MAVVGCVLEESECVSATANVQREESLLVFKRWARRYCAFAAQKGKLFGKTAKQRVQLVFSV